MYTHTIDKHLEESVDLDLRGYQTPDGDTPIVLAIIDVTGWQGRQRVAARIDVAKRMFLDYPDDPVSAAKMRVLAPKIAEEIAKKMRRTRKSK